MKTSINVEFTDEELRKYATDVFRRVGLNFIHDTIRHLAGLKINPDVMSTFVSAVATVLTSSKQTGDPGPKAETPSPAEHNYSRPDRCSHVKASPFSDEGWWCCKCSTLNNDTRGLCRACGHERCDAVTPPTNPADPSVQ
jgi:hypothetical protein